MCAKNYFRPKSKMLKIPHFFFSLEHFPYFPLARSTTCVVVYLMLKYDWGALQALRHIRHARPVEINEGFLQQLADLDFKIKWYKNKTEEDQKIK